MSDANDLIAPILELAHRMHSATGSGLQRMTLDPCAYDELAKSADRTIRRGAIMHGRTGHARPMIVLSTSAGDLEIWRGDDRP